MSTHLNLPARAGAGVRAMAARRAASVPEGKAAISLVRPTTPPREDCAHHGWRRCWLPRGAPLQQSRGHPRCPVWFTDPIWGRAIHDHTWSCLQST